MVTKLWRVCGGFKEVVGESLRDLARGNGVSIGPAFSRQILTDLAIQRIFQETRTTERRAIKRDKSCARPLPPMADGSSQSCRKAPSQRPSRLTREANGLGSRVISPLPSWPSEFAPQQSACPFSLTAHVKFVPADTPDALVIRLTRTRRFLSTMVPSPSSPLLLFPQHARNVFSFKAQVW